MMYARTEARAFCTGIGLYAYQAAQSLDRALYSDLEELRKFYSERIQPGDLAHTLVRLEPSLREVNRCSFKRLIFGRKLVQIDLWIMSRLLLDFSNVLKGGDFEIEDLGCLRYCLTITSSKFLQGKGKLEMENLIYYGRNIIFGAGIEIDHILGKSWNRMD